jgi:prepilin-type N-terminal cleavage/methylation domain-containing protein/prepilin-type processing-associated H-X9-DG protein
MSHPQSVPSPQEANRSCILADSLRAFTLIEILVVIAIIAILSTLLFPVLSSAKARSKQTGCANNLKQVALGFQMYAADNDGRLPENPPSGFGDTRWVSGNMKIRQEATNQSLIRQGKLFAYANGASLFRCPGDVSQVDGLSRTRSYSMNSWIGSRYMETNCRLPYRTFIRDVELAAARPASLWSFVDEHEMTIDDGCFVVTMDDKKPFVSAPAIRHQQGYGLSFADGHVETKKLRDPNSDSLGAQHSWIHAMNSDWLQLKQLTTIP